ncbi:MAG: hypothetical protein II689_00850, partial [Firmicutes bacterium]|nr:hypothetical protein [Bacillota bacterium]
GGTVRWSLENNSGLGASGSGTVDADGNVHVFLAPIFEKYNFINFMLRARGTSLSSQAMMTRKLIALGSASSASVKISDVQSNSTDPVHLVFTGWEYDENAGTGNPESWRQRTTMDATGAELSPPVYETFNLQDKASIDLYPIFIEARWTDFNVGPTGSGASYVSSRYLESWSAATPQGTTEVEDKNVFKSLAVPTRQGYVFGGWYAFAKTNEAGEITNLDTAESIAVQYVDVNNKYNTLSETISTMAVQITNGSGAVVYNGTFTLPASGQTLFEGNGSSLKLRDPLDRLTLYARWIPNASQVTVVYWTENAQDYGFVPSTDVEVTYSANRALILTTEDLNDLYESKVTSGTRPFASGSTITYANLLALGLLDTSNLTGAVPAGDEKFYEVVSTQTKIGEGKDEHGASKDIYPDASKVIDGDGRTVFNVYFDRMTFKLVFHIGRDGYVKNAGQQKASSYPNWDGNWIEYMYNDQAVTALGYTGKGQSSYHGYFTMTYTPTGKTYTSEYITTGGPTGNVMGDYLPNPANNVNDQNLYIITAKYGAYIGDRWPSPTNPDFSFTNAVVNGKEKTLYIWTAYYKSLYAGIANSRPTTGGNNDGNNSDINGVYEYMSAELCANRDGTGLINTNHVHHLVAYFGEASNQNRYKQYHILVEAIDGTYDPSAVNLVSGSDYSGYVRTTWSEQKPAYSSMIAGQEYYELSVSPVISNLQPQY